MNDENVELPSLPNYVSIKEAAKILGISDKTVYEYVSSQRLPGVWAADVIMIALTDVEKFRRKAVGRPRKTVPTWRISSKDNILYVTSITVMIRTEQPILYQRLEEIRQGGQHIFEGTVARYIMGKAVSPHNLKILLIWKSSVMPDEPTRELELTAFREALADVVDWDTARYEDDVVYMHT